MARKRDFKAEYQRRMANAAKRGLSRSQARGHARANEQPVRAKPVQSDDRLEGALKLLRQNGDRTAAAKSFGIAPERFRRFLLGNVQVEGRGRSLKITDNRHRYMSVISRGEAQELRLRDYDQASLNGQHLSAVREYIRTNVRELLLPFNDRVVIDAKGKAHPLETDPNELHRIAAQGDEVFHEIYRLVLKGA